MSLRLFVWEGVLTDYTDGIMFALADSADQARDMICPRWTEAEERIRNGTAVSDERPFGPEPGVNSGHGYCVTMMHQELRAEPDVYDSPKGFALWGGS